MAEAKSSVTFQANALARAYGKTLKVTADDVLWAMGQVGSQMPWFLYAATVLTWICAVCLEANAGVEQ